MRRSYTLSPSVTSRVPHGLVFAAHVRVILAHLPLTTLCAPAGRVGESWPLH